MKSRFDIKHDIGKITPDSLDDLYILKQIITPDSFVTSKTPRSVKIRRGNELIRAKTGRREVVLKIKVEKVELVERLRLTGKIVEAPETVERGYHTIDVELGTFIKVEKEWKNWEINWIKSAERKPEPILICVLDETEADFYLLKERYKHLLHIRSEVSGKRFEAKKAEKKRQEYYSKILNQIVKKSERVKKIIIAGPGFAREDISRIIKIRNKELLEKIMLEFIYQTGDLGLKELLKGGLIERLTKFSKIAKETQAVEMLLTEMKKNGNVVYGLEKTKEALNNIDLLLISDEKVREFEEILNLADNMRIRIMIISSEHGSGQQLLGLGGIAGLLRFKKY